MAADTYTRCSSAELFPRTNPSSSHIMQNYLFTANSKAMEENERLKKENARLKSSESSLKRENADLLKHSRYHEENVLSARRDSQQAFSRLAEVEAELDIVKQLLRRYQHTEMQEVSQRRRAALEHHRAHFETRHGGDVVATHPWRMEDGEGLDEIDSGVGMDAPLSPMLLSLPESSTSSGDLPLRDTGSSHNDVDTVDGVRESRSGSDRRSRVQVHEEEESGYDVI